MGATPVVQTYAKAQVATSNVDFTIGVADAIFILEVPSDITLTLVAGGGSLVLADTSNLRAGDVLPIRCSRAVFTGGALVAMAVN